MLSCEDVLRAAGGRLLQGERNGFFRGVSTDSRTIEEGQLFIALRGFQFDGHHFALEALKRKAGGVLIDEDKAGDFRWNGYYPKIVIAVKDTLLALGDIAQDRRRKYGTPVVALTGSNGKTTTKEMIAVCLETSLPILKTTGNFNNLIGLPLTLLKLSEKERVVILEMGMNVPGEIRRLTEIAEPDVGLITNIERVHLEGVGSIERVKEEKGQLFQRMRKDGTILVNQDDVRVIELAKRFSGNKITFGIDNPADIMAKRIQFKGSEGISFVLISEGEEMEMSLPLIGRHFVPNALCAIAIAKLFRIEMKKVIESLEHFQPFPMRMEIVHLNGGKMAINDAYNANPKSMDLALETLVELKGEGRAIAVLGDMLELGDLTQEAHQQLGKKVAELSVDLLITLGEQAWVVSESAIRHGLPADRVRIAESHPESLSILKQMMKEGDWILVKGSRRMAMEKIITELIGREA
ncbi:MAG: hypothetical protein A2169_14820 [Deltaproteobacteria bacterium RBG_13_47_9]|nr:MAG: hypothetical protein A2169_14820 [Deltaproteobacteria bacterium RBG_13_47_9]